ncbi:MAG TPA: malto-oligosyltrehalose trehalohydrolase [Burkholderiales bacterium]|nr:malto-oligosyltrehalose trehalohydrolase [Burkholderiales bacterium]
MPFGCDVSRDGARFRLWAPASSTAQLSLEGPDLTGTLAMKPVGSGWFEVDCPGAHPGSRYRFLLDNGVRVPDPASRANPDDVHGPSLVVDPLAFDWQDDDWRGRPWEDTVIYEVHVGTFSAEGTFEGVERRLDYLLDLGVTAIELMPVADFPGRRNWGYDGVLLFAPESRYGTPEHFKRLVQSAHRRGLMVFLDVVYNHFGPDGNYLHLYAPQFFTDRHHTPWGPAINFDGPEKQTVREFYAHNALYWLEEFHLDGLRLDAVHAIADDSRPDILEEIAAAVHAGPGADRHVHLVLENDRNAASKLGGRPGEPGRYDAQWNDDAHHALHVLLTGETDGYYRDYADDPVARLGRTLAEGFAYQGEPSPYRGGRPRGESSAWLRPTAFVPFLQNHDQVGNRAFGERIARLAEPGPLRAAVAILLLAPSPPLLFMGEEWAAREPFPFFCDFEGELAAKVANGRRSEFARFDRFRDAVARLLIPDPGAQTTFDSAQLDWHNQLLPGHREWLAVYRSLLHVRAREIAPRLTGMSGGARFTVTAPTLLSVDWTLGDGCALHLLANLGPDAHERAPRQHGRVLYTSDPDLDPALSGGALPPWTVAWTLEPRNV